MTQAVLRIAELPGDALGAAAAFHGEWLPRVRALLADGAEALAVVLPGAAYDHNDWRRAAARDLARAAAPTRANIVAGDDSQAVAAILAYLERAPGVTGQYLRTAGDAAG